MFNAFIIAILAFCAPSVIEVNTAGTVEVSHSNRIIIELLKEDKIAVNGQAMGVCELESELWAVKDLDPNSNQLVEIRARNEVNMPVIHCIKEQMLNQDLLYLLYNINGQSARVKLIRDNFEDQKYTPLHVHLTGQDKVIFNEDEFKFNDFKSAFISSLSSDGIYKIFLSADRNISDELYHLLKTDLGDLENNFTLKLVEPCCVDG